MKGMLLRFGLIVMAACLAAPALALDAGGVGGGESQPKPVTKLKRISHEDLLVMSATIDMAQAIEAALGKVEGDVVAAELRNEREYVVYTVRVAPKKGGEIVVLHVDAGTGALVSVEWRESSGTGARGRDDARARRAREIIDAAKRDRLDEAASPKAKEGEARREKAQSPQLQKPEGAEGAKPEGKTPEVKPEEGKQQQ